MNIGIPEGLFYFKYYPLWKTFFESLGASVSFSGDSNKRILDMGVKLCVDEACLPVKIYHGHVESIKDHVDALFIPRIMSIKKNEYICPKFCGLPEMIKNSVPDLPYIIDTTINLRRSENNIAKAAEMAAMPITGDKARIKKALNEGICAQREYDMKLSKYEYINNLGNKKGQYGIERNKKIAVLGHPYIIYDSFINMGIVKKLFDAGYSVVTPQMVDTKTINENASNLNKRHFWTLGRELLGAGLSFVKNIYIDGIIYMSSFCCGIDSLMEDYLERQIRKKGDIPYMKIVLDEHSGEAGFDTRLEAFIDMIGWREQNAGNIPTHGQCIYSSERLS